MAIHIADQTNLAKSVQDAYVIANIHGLATTESYFDTQIPIFNESSLYNWVERDPRLTVAGKAFIRDKINEGTLAAKICASVGGVLVGTVGAIGTKALMTHGILVTPANPVAGIAMIGAGAVAGVAAGAVGGGFLGAKLGELPSTDEALNAVYLSYRDLFKIRAFVSFLSEDAQRGVVQTISEKFICPLEDTIPSFPVCDTWEENGEINYQYYESSALKAHILANRGIILNSIRPMGHHALSLNHAVHYWQDLSRELQYHFGVRFQKERFDSKAENLRYLNRYMVKITTKSAECATQNIDYPAQIYGECMEFLLNQRRAIAI